MSDDYEFEVWQDGIMVASVSASSLDAARREAMHYAFIYAQDGPVELRVKPSARSLNPRARRRGARDE